MVGCDQNSIPVWMQILLGAKFFDPCLVHQDAKKNERNMFCLDCCITICAHCLNPLHPRPRHRLLQIRRYVYRDVVRLVDAQKLMNCSSVQPYTTNSAKVVFLRQRPSSLQSRPFRGSGNFCNSCHRSLQDPFLFCSLSCKVHHLVKRTKSGIRKHIYDYEFYSMFDKTIVEDDRVTPDSVLNSAPSLGTSNSGSTTSAPNFHGPINFRTRGALACTATTELVIMKKRRTTVVSWPAAEEAAGSINRRKGVPRRSPLY